MDSKPNVQSAEVVLLCRELSDTVAFLVETLGFRVDTIFPADDPSVAVISGYGARIRLQRSDHCEAGVIRLVCGDPDALARGKTMLVAPGGLVIELVAANAAVVLPPNEPAFVLSRLSEQSSWIVGRAGMRYRDLVPERQGGRFIASHIQILDGGEVPDYVHFHRVRFQMIYCYQGWVRVVYEDQGPPFILNAGDCVLQPPQIRHRVLECSDGLEVLEVGCPAEHTTHADHELALPTNKVRAHRDFHGQRFVRHVAHTAEWQAWPGIGFESRDMGIAAATEDLAGARVVRPRSPRSGSPQFRVCSVDTEFLFTFVLQGSVSLDRTEQGPERLQAGDCFTMPAGLRYRLTECSDDLEFLEVSLPAAHPPAPPGPVGDADERAAPGR